VPNLTQQITNNFQSLSVLIASFLLERKSRGLQPRSIEFYRGHLKHFSTWLDPQGITQIDQVTPAVIRGFFIHLEEGHRLGYVHGYFRSLRAFFRWLALEEILPPEWKNPMRKVMSPKVPTDPLEPIPADDIRRLLATCRDGFTDARDKAIILTLLDTGARANELLSMNHTDCNFVVGDILIRQGKGKKPRTVFAGKVTRRALRAYVRLRSDQCVALFVTDESERLTYDGLRAIITRRAKLAEIKPPPLHGFRRTFAISMLRAGTDLISLSRLLGHADLQMVLKYAKQNSDDLREAHAKASPADSMG
jgi:integrase/recombinase XerD